MTLLIIALAAVFLAGLALGAFALIVIGIHLEERRMTRKRIADNAAAAATRRVLATGFDREEARR